MRQSGFQVRAATGILMSHDMSTLRQDDWQNRRENDAEKRLLRRREEKKVKKCISMSLSPSPHAHPHTPLSEYVATGLGIDREVSEQEATQKSVTDEWPVEQTHVCEDERREKASRDLSHIPW